MTRGSPGVGIFPSLINDRRADSEYDAFLVCSTTIKRWGRKTFSYSFHFLLHLLVHFWLCTFEKNDLFLALPPFCHPQVRVFFPFQLNLFLFLRIASQSWHTVDQHPHIGTGEHMGLLCWLKVLVWWAHNMSLTSWLPAWLNLSLGKRNILLRFLFVYNSSLPWPYPWNEQDFPK